MHILRVKLFQKLLFFKKIHMQSAIENSSNKNICIVLQILRKFCYWKIVVKFPAFSEVELQEKKTILRKRA